jgi:undecaprenyl-phosphate 4-deoxy-4-formamido-L-arabinose transferase
VIVSETVSIVIPVFNELATLDELVERVVRACESMSRAYEVILVDDGSSDGSSARLLEHAETYGGKVMAVLLNRNYGQHAAVMAGFAESRGDFVITLDADLQNPPEEIPALAAKMAEGYDLVGSVRRERKDSLFRRLSSAIINWTVRACTGVRMTDSGCMLRAYRRPVVDAMLRCHERSTFIPLLATSFAKKTCEIEVGHADRPRGTSKYGIWQLVNLQLDLLTSMTTFPLRLLSMMGIVISAAGFGFGLLLFILRVVYGPEWAVGGVFSLFAVLFIFIGAQFVAMGLLGEYIGRIYHDVRARPRYFVHRVAGRSHPAPGDRSEDGDRSRSTGGAAGLGHLPWTEEAENRR